MATILRDDSALRSLSSNERSFVRNCATATRTSGTSTEDGSGASSSSGGAVLRMDGRHPGEIRSIRLTFGRTTTGRSECTVQLGLTRVGCIVTCDLVPPQSRPNDGSIKFSVDLSPMAMMGFSSSLDYDEGKKHMANRIARVIEKTIVDGGAIDVESLCVVGGTWVWRINVDITALDHGGNLLDASMLAAIAALRHFRKPEVIVSPNSSTTSSSSSTASSGATAIGNARGAPIILSSDDAEPTPLPLHHTPVCVTFGLFGDPSGASSLVAALIDPSDREELIMDGLITYAFNKYGELCCLDFPGGCELRYSQLIQCATLAEKKAVELCKMLEEALEAAEEKAWAERMERLSKRSSVVVDMMSRRTRGEEEKGLFAIPELDDATPLDAFLSATTSTSQTVHIMEEEPTYVTDTANYLAMVEEEEKYRLQALDYSLGHVAVKVKEQMDKGGGLSSHLRSSKEVASGNLGGTLIQTMIRASRSISTENTNKSAESNLYTAIDHPLPSHSDDQNQNSLTSRLHNTSANDNYASRNINYSDTRRIDAEEEFDTYAKMVTSSEDNIMDNKPSDNNMLAEDEEDVTVLQSEFTTVVPAAQVKNKQKTSEEGIDTIQTDEDEIDLFMAIKRKGKSNKGKKKK